MYDVPGTARTAHTCTPLATVGTHPARTIANNPRPGCIQILLEANSIFVDIGAVAWDTIAGVVHLIR